MTNSKCRHKIVTNNLNYYCDDCKQKIKQNRLMALEALYKDGYYCDIEYHQRKKLKINGLP